MLDEELWNNATFSPDRKAALHQLAQVMDLTGVAHHETLVAHEITHTWSDAMVASLYLMIIRRSHETAAMLDDLEESEDEDVLLAIAESYNEDTTWAPDDRDQSVTRVAIDART